MIAGDLSEDDLTRAVPYIDEPSPMSDFSEFAYGSDTVYFVQPSLSQFVPGGSGAGTFIPPAQIGLKGPLNNTLASTGRNTVKGDTGAILRYAPSACQCTLTS